MAVIIVRPPHADTGHVAKEPSPEQPGAKTWCGIAIDAGWQPVVGVAPEVAPCHACLRAFIWDRAGVPRDRFVAAIKDPGEPAFVDELSLADVLTHVLFSSEIIRIAPAVVTISGPGDPNVRLPDTTILRGRVMVVASLADVIGPLPLESAIQAAWLLDEFAKGVLS